MTNVQASVYNITLDRLRAEWTRRRMTDTSVTAPSAIPSTVVLSNVTAERANLYIAVLKSMASTSKIPGIMNEFNPPSGNLQVRYAKTNIKLISDQTFDALLTQLENESLVVQGEPPPPPPPVTSGSQFFGASLLPVFWSVPNGVHSINISGAAGGGGGGSGGWAVPFSSLYLYPTAGQGGGAGQPFYKRAFTVIPGEVLTIWVGSGGWGGAYEPDGGMGQPNAGRHGADTFFSSQSSIHPTTLRGGDGGRDGVFVYYGDVQTERYNGQAGGPGATAGVSPSPGSTIGGSGGTILNGTGIAGWGGNGASPGQPGSNGQDGALLIEW